jgi:DNA-binding LacI/PurR family transcriptional regulator
MTSDEQRTDDGPRQRPPSSRVGPGRATIADVAEHAGVSLQTVSNAINAPHRLRPETLDKVMASVAHLRYTPNHAARSLRTQSAAMFGCRLLPPDRRGSGGVLDRFLYALSDEARSAGHGLVCHAAATDEEELDIIDSLVRRSAVDGFVITGTHHGDLRPAWLRKRGIPFVSFGRPWGAGVSGHCWVDVDETAGTAAATEHLIAGGHKRIAFLGWPEPNGVGEQRRAGWVQTIKRRRLPLRGNSVTCGDDVESGRHAAAQMLERDNGPTGFVCASDAIAIGVLHAVNDRGLRAGPDIGIVGFDDSVGSQLVRPFLSTVRQPLDRVAHEIVRLLVGNVGRGRRRAERVLLTPDLIVRESSPR